MTSEISVNDFHSLIGAHVERLGWVLSILVDKCPGHGDVETGVMLAFHLVEEFDELIANTKII